MDNFTELMGILSVPRPNGSQAERETLSALREWLARHKILDRIHRFKLYPYSNEALGVWLILFSTLVALSIVLRWGWLSLVIVVAGLLGSVLHVLTNFTTWLWARQGENLLVEFEPPEAKQEMVLSAHYDSKTELLDHQQRAFFTDNLAYGVALMIIVGLLGLVEQLLHTRAPDLANIVYWAGIWLSLVILILCWAYGLNLVLGRFVTPSQGAIDNGTACAILLDLADRLARDEVSLESTRVTVILFTGEEVGMQGSRAYVESREWPLAAAAINLEIMAQDGDYVIWQHQGNGFRTMPTTPWLNKAVAGAVLESTGAPARSVDLLLSDGFSFLSAGIPTTVLGTYHSQMEGGGLHRPTDNLDRVVMSRLPEAVEVLTSVLSRYDAGELQA
jgi:hypothetical protein